MNRVDVIRMAQESGLACKSGTITDWIDAGPGGEELIQFAVLIAKQEREECANLCDELSEKHTWEGCYANECAEAIRNKGKK